MCLLCVVRQAVTSGRQLGGAFAVYHQGAPVVSVWGGYADDEAGVPWDENTLCMTFSCAKVLVGIVAGMLVDR